MLSLFCIFSLPGLEYKLFSTVFRALYVLPACLLILASITLLQASSVTGLPSDLPHPEGTTLSIHSVPVPFPGVSP